MREPQEDIINSVRNAALPFDHNVKQTFMPVLELVKHKSFILLGEATHGTREFYEARIEITKQLIINDKLHAIAIEGDWPSAYRVNRYVRWQGHDTNANEALSGFKRFPLWMWRNTVMLDFIEWLRHHNEDLPAKQQVGFYGLDMYSMYESVAAVLEYLGQVDPNAAREARKNYACLDHTKNAQYNLGQLARERYGDDCVLIGFTTYTGTVTAASEWGGPAERKNIRMAAEDSIEHIFHKTDLKNFYNHLANPANKKILNLFSKKKEQRAIGVVYRPEAERASHYFTCELAHQFDAIIHYDETSALEPLDPEN
jgi:erythromycin esterase-like protein